MKVLLLIIVVLLIIGIFMYKGGLEIKEVIWGLLLDIVITFIIGFVCYLIKKDI